MELVLKRTNLQPDYTLGELLDADGKHICYTCEDTVRDPGQKVPGHTAIPYGRYKVVIDFSPRFNTDMPHILDVPMFEGIRIHPGNTAADTEGCVLVGSQLGPDRVLGSVAAFRPFLYFLKQAVATGEVWITIE